MPLFITANTYHSMEIYAGAFGLNGLGSLDTVMIGTSKMTLAFLLVSVIWLVVTGFINRRFYRLKQDVYVMSHVSRGQALILWGAFGLAVTKLAASSFSPFLYFQF